VRRRQPLVLHQQALHQQALHQQALHQLLSHKLERPSKKLLLQKHKLRWQPNQKIPQ
jgi:hypothetical protein